MVSKPMRWTYGKTYSWITALICQLYVVIWTKEIQLGNWLLNIIWLVLQISLSDNSLFLVLIVNWDQQRFLNSRMIFINWVICWEVDGSRDCHTEWSNSEREKQISYIHAYMWNLEKWYKWTGFQGRSKDTDVENKHMDTKGGIGAWDELGDWDRHIYTTMYKTDN